MTESRRPSDVRDLQARSDARHTRLVAHHDLDGHGDGMQVIKRESFLYVSHLGRSPIALSILDVSDPENPELVRQLPHEPNTHRHKVQIAGDVLIQNCEKPDDPPPGDDPPAVTGMAVFDLSDPTDPRRIGVHPVGGRGVHRMWYSEPPYAHIAAYLPGTPARGYQIVDLSVPAAPRMVGAWWVPGSRDDDPAPWPRFHDGAEHEIHGVVPHGDRAYASCTDAGFALLDIGDVTAPRLLGRVNWHPPFGGFCHTSLPLPRRRLVLGVCESIADDAAEDGDKRIWVIDVREERQPVLTASFPAAPAAPGRAVGRLRRPAGALRPPQRPREPPGQLPERDPDLQHVGFNAGLRIVDTERRRPARRRSAPLRAAAGARPGRAPRATTCTSTPTGSSTWTDRYGGGLDVIEYRPG